jgi:uncharacterized membrane protein YfcA
MAVAPMLATAMPAKTAIGLMLPLLLAGDVMTLIGYRGRWDRGNLIQLLPGALVGIAVGSLVLGQLSTDGLTRAIGVLALVFVAIQAVRDRWVPSEEAPRYPRATGVMVGFGSGLISTLSHLGGLLTTMYLLPQRLPNQSFVATASALFFWMNVAKLVPYFRQGLLTLPMLRMEALVLPLLFAGALIGFSLNRRVPTRAFNRILLVFVMITGLKLAILGA